MNRPHLMATSTTGQLPNGRSAFLSVRGDVGRDVELGTVGIVPPLVPDGTYSAGFVRAERGRFEHRERWFLWFRLTTVGPHYGEELYLCCPFPATGTKFGLGSKLVDAYRVATGQMPQRRDRISTKVFRGKLFRIKTRTVTTDRERQARPPDTRYSVIDRLLDVEAGS